MYELLISVCEDGKPDDPTIEHFHHVTASIPDYETEEQAWNAASALENAIDRDPLIKLLGITATFIVVPPDCQ